MLSHGETMALLKLAGKGDKAALDRLTEENLGLVHAVVRRYTGRGTEYEDLYQLGCLGLMKAIQKFDPSFGVRFSTYAVPMIAGEVKRFLRDDGQVKVGRALKELAAKALAAGERLTEETGAVPGVLEIAAALRVSPEEVALSLTAARPALSFSEPVGDGDDARTRADTVADPAREDALIDRLLIKELLSTLDQRERKIIALRYFRDRTQTEVAAQIGVSQVQVSRLESRILKKLRAAAGETEKT